MTTGPGITSRPPSLRCGLTLVEMAISIVFVGIALVVALNAVGASKLGQVKVSVRREGHLLAQDLMGEILRQDYADPVDGPDSFGMSKAEAATGDRSRFDDVDDYDGWYSKPPQRKNGDVMKDLPGWERIVDVVWVNPLDLSQTVESNRGIKSIKVQVKYNGGPQARLVALKTAGLPPLQACCFDDSSCEDLREEACATEGGTAQGPGTTCAGTECPSGNVVLFVSGGTLVEGPLGDTIPEPTEQENLRIELIESWGFSVELIEASAAQSEFDAAIPDVDVAYIPIDIDAAVLGTKLTEAEIGVVIEKMMNEFGVATDWQNKTRDCIKIIDNSHYITSPFDPGELTYLSSLQLVTTINGGFAPSLNTLAEVFNVGSLWKPALAVVDAGGELSEGGTAAGRRVQLPWGDNGFDVNALNEDGQTIMQRSIEWAAEPVTVCGDGECAVEEQCTCPDDCGEPTSFEDPGINCDDGLDNDCDGVIDCHDINCLTDPACVTYCGNATCSKGENPCGCPEDCGDPTAWELAGVNCDDGIDNDCDGHMDCADLDCSTDPTCCKPVGGPCVINSDCCSGECNVGKNTCN